MCLNNKCPKFSSVKIKHHFNGITIPDNLPDKECKFNKKEGLPIKVSVESFLIINIPCNHEINHTFTFPIESLIEWKIVNGIKDGAFKHGYGLKSTYADTDNENCVIYYPIRKGTEDDYKDKEIPILISIRSNKIRESIVNFSANGSYENKSTFVMEDNANLLLILRLKQKKGFLNKIYYESSITVKQIFQNELEYSSRQITTNSKNDENSNLTYSFDENKKTFSIENNCVCKCAECKLSITFKSHRIYSDTNQVKMNIDTNRFLSSEYIKISNSISEDVYTADRPDIDFDIKNHNKRIDEFRINNCPVIKTKETFWTSTAGSFPCGGNSNSIIYYSLKEKELSKSPITLTLYEKNSCERKGEESFYLVDQKKIWILRRGIMGG